MHYLPLDFHVLSLQHRNKILKVTRENFTQCYSLIFCIGSLLTVSHLCPVDRGVRNLEERIREVQVYTHFLCKLWFDYMYI